MRLKVNAVAPSAPTKELQWRMVCVKRNFLLAEGRFFNHRDVDLAHALTVYLSIGLSRAAKP